MTCDDVTALLDAFVDTELPSPMLVAVARHAAACPACDGAVRDIEAAHEAVGRTLVSDAEALDLSRVWPAVEAAAARADARRAWVARLRAAPAWSAAAALALAASALLWFRPAPPVRVAAAARPNQAVIERLDTSSHVELRRDRKYGTTLIMVSAPAMGAP